MIDFESTELYKKLQAWLGHKAFVIEEDKIKETEIKSITFSKNNIYIDVEFNGCFLSRYSIRTYKTTWFISLLEAQNALGRKVNKALEREGIFEDNFLRS